MMKRIIYQIRGLDMHVRMTGKGFPLVLLHESPNSSAMFLPMAEVLKDHFTLIMPDTPGYGLSDDLPFFGLPKISDYVPYFRILFAQMGVKKVAIYGSGTGAQLAIRLGLTYPEVVEHLFLDNAAHFTSEQFASIKEKYFPELGPTYEGSHLLKMWTMIRDRFRYFPWYMREKDNQLALVPPPVSDYHSLAMDFLQAGANYSKAYEAAFGHEHIKNVQNLSIATTIYRNEGSIVRPFIDQLISHHFSRNVKLLKTPADLADRYETMLLDMQAELPQSYEEIEDKNEGISKSGQFLVEIEGKYLHGWLNKRGTGMPLLIVPEGAGSASLLKDTFDELRQERPGVILSLPGQGESDSWGSELTGEEKDYLVAKLMKKLGYSSFELIRSPIEGSEIEIQAPDAYGLYMIKAWMDLREHAGENADPDRIQLLLNERLKYRKH